MRFLPVGCLDDEDPVAGLPALDGLLGGLPLMVGLPLVMDGFDADVTLPLPAST